MRRQAVAEKMRPVPARVMRHVQASAGPVGRRVNTPWWPPCLPQRCEDCVRVAGLEGEIDGAGVLILEQHARPARATIRRAKYATLAVWAISVAKRGDQHQIRILRADQDAPNLPRI